MSISEISKAGPALVVSTGIQTGAAANDGGRQKVSPGGNASPPAAQSLPAGQAPVAPTPRDTEKAVEIVEEFLQAHSRSLQFEVDEQSGMEILTVRDGETGEVVRRFPSDEVVASARYIAENTADVTSGVLINNES
ncbi:MAG: hypothetical protein Hals2KO_33460 [Halioglobus sp.]